MTPDRRYSLWLLPGLEAGRRFQSLIDRLSERLGTPRFEPHITLTGSLTGDEEMLRQRTRALAAGIEAFEARLLGAAYRDEYYRCLFVEVSLSGALQAARATARREFEQRGESEFYPHLSLVYGDLKPEEKEKILDDIGRRFGEPVPIGELALYETSGPPAEWRCVERAPLQPEV